MFFDHVAVLGGDFVLEALDLGAGELDDLAGVDVDHVVVVLAAVEFVHRLATLEVVLEHQAGRFELGKHPVHRGQADVGVVLQQGLEHVFGRHVAALGALEHLEDLDARQRGLQAAALELVGVGLGRVGAVGHGAWLESSDDIQPGRQRPAPRSSACSDASWIIGPSMTGSENGIPISIASAPLAAAARTASVQPKYPPVM